MKVSFSFMVPDLLAKSRHRTVRSGRRCPTCGQGSSVRTYTPKGTVAYEGRIAWAAKQSRDLQLTRDGFWPCPFPAKVRILAMKKRKARGPWKPDIDNIAKAVLDGLTLSGCWVDDNQVTRLEVLKVNGKDNMLEVTVTFEGEA